MYVYDYSITEFSLSKFGHKVPSCFLSSHF